MSHSYSPLIRRRHRRPWALNLSFLFLLVASSNTATTCAFLTHRRPSFRIRVSAIKNHQSKLREPENYVPPRKLSLPPKQSGQFLARKSIAQESNTTYTNPGFFDSKRFGTAWASLVLSLILIFSPTAPAHAGFGPSSGATTSAPPGLTTPNVQNQDLIGGSTGNKKLKVRIGSTLDERRLQEFNQQLDGIIESLKDREAAATLNDSRNVGEEKTKTSTIEITAANSEDELEKAKLLQSQILEREKLLDALEAQPYWFNYLAAFVGSLASTLIMHPIDTIKTRQQLNAASEAAAAAKLLEEANEMESPHYHEHNTTLMLSNNEMTFEDVTAAHGMYSRSNFLSLYEGLTGNIWKEGPPSALYLGVYETVKSSFLQQLSNPKYLLFVYLLSGAAGEMVGSVIRAPAEAVKSLVQSKATNSALEAAQQVLGTYEGRQNVLRAWSASIGRDVPFGAIQLATFELVKAAILNNPNIDFDSSTLSSEAIIGAFAGACGAFITNPADVITTRIITQSTNDKSDGLNKTAIKPLGVIGMGLKIYQEEGWSAFFTGWTARVGYWAPAISIFLTCYCSVRQAGVRYDLFG